MRFDRRSRDRLHSASGVPCSGFASWVRISALSFGRTAANAAGQIGDRRSSLVSLGVRPRACCPHQVTRCVLFVDGLQRQRSARKLLRLHSIQNELFHHQQRGTARATFVTSSANRLLENGTRRPRPHVCPGKGCHGNCEINRHIHAWRRVDWPGTRPRPYIARIELSDAERTRRESLGFQSRHRPNCERSFRCRDRGFLPEFRSPIVVARQVSRSRSRRIIRLDRRIV